MNSQPTSTANALRHRYRTLNESFQRRLIYHVGIDAGFFAEYNYLIAAMLWCLQHKVRFVLFADDANFGHTRGWQDYFEPFCEEVHDSFHRRYNRHRTPSWPRICRMVRQQQSLRPIKWKVKSLWLNAVGSLLAWRTYGQRTYLNHHIDFDPKQPIAIPELDIAGNYLEAFNQLSDIVWHLRPEVSATCRRYAEQIALPAHYVGCQVRGGDKVTEVNLLPPQAYIDTLRQVAPDAPVFLLTDDYRLYESLRQADPNRRWYTLCQPEEKGYVNSTFTQQQGPSKGEQMIRFLSSMELLLRADQFVGSITTGPSLFVLKRLHPRITLMDCTPGQFTQAICLPIGARGTLATDFLKQQAAQQQKERHYTSEELQQLHQVLYEILEQIIRICKKHQIPYFVIGGTAIGALYDQAILPWDDDVDIGMLREDYDRFLQVAPQELGADYFLSTVESDPHSPYYFAKVKKEHTCFIDPLFPQVPMHPGIFVDIFPFDRIPDHPTLRRLQHEAVKFVNCCLMGKEAWLWPHFGTSLVPTPSHRGRIPCLLNRLIDCLLSKRTIFHLMRCLQTASNQQHTHYYNNVMTVTDRISESQVHDLIEVPFGPLQLTAPRELEAFLRHNYPHLHRFTPEEVNRLAGHYPAKLSFDTRRSETLHTENPQPQSSTPHTQQP